MSRLLRAAPAIVAAPLLASCMFLLDFDELEGTAETASGGGAGVGTGGSTGGDFSEAGSGGDGCGSCDDQDPCTIDTCNDTGGAAACSHQEREGLALDGFDATLPAQAHLRVAMVGSGNDFYLSAFDVNDDVPEVTLYRLASDGTELETLLELSELAMGGYPVSNAGLAIDPTLGLAVHGFVAVQPAEAASAPRVMHLVYRSNGDASLALAGTSYIQENPWVFPQALAIGNRVAGAWIQQDGTISVQGLASGPLVLGDPALPASTLALLSTGTDQPAVMFSAETPNTSFGVYVATSAGRTQVMECQMAQGRYVSSSVIASQLPGIWLGSFTKGGDDYLTSGSATLACVDNNCRADTDPCQSTDLANSVRNVAGATLHFEADEPGVVYAVLVIPQLQPDADATTGVEARLSAAVGRLDFSQAETTNSPVGQALELASQPTGEEQSFTGPDWPAVSILPSQQVGIAWIQPQAGGAGSELRIQRYKMCLPKP